MHLYELSVKKRNGEDYDLSALKGKVLLIVNTATGCGFTPQYEGLEKLYEKYHDQGFEILDFPCDQFGHQAPGTDDEIHAFCTSKYNTTFDQFAKIEVNGENESPVYTYLKQQQPTEEVIGIKNKMAMAAIVKISATCQKEGDIVWNFTKFLVDKEGNVTGRYDPTRDPLDIEEEIAALL
ncbi:MAG: glutathione peroxidase [Erysipelotrichaceae bacterium]|nr:glutathione peroxidase [Erysipelotrichaceae bacterium]